MRRLAILILCVMLPALVPACSTSPTDTLADTSGPVRPDTSLRIGTRKQLFIDDLIVERKHNVTRQIGKVEKANGGKPVIVPDQEWEHPLRFAFYLAAAYDERAKKFKMWYLAQMPGHVDRSKRSAKYTAVAYAESDDGVNWKKPLIGMDYGEIPDVTGKGRKSIKTNVVILAHGFSAFIDPTVPWGHPEKFKAAYDDEFDWACQTSIGYSDDGIHWRAYNNRKPVVWRAADTLSQLLWDPISQKYMIVCREDLAGAGGKGETRGSRVMIRKDNNDLMKDPSGWRDVSILKFDRYGWKRERTDRQIHATTVWPYEGHYLACLNAMEGELDGRADKNDDEPEVRHETNIMNVYLAPSRDAVKWNYDWAYEQVPLIPRGGTGEWDNDGIHSVSMFVHNDKIWLYYCGLSERFDSDGERAWMRIGLATLRLDGFVCLAAKERIGKVITKPFKLEGDRLEVNVDAKGGWVRVELLDAAGAPIPGFSGKDAKIHKGIDELRFAPQWKSRGDLSKLKGKIVRLRFTLRNAKLYAFEFGK